jgi:hypothetical protein
LATAAGSMRTLTGPSLTKVGPLLPTCAQAWLYALPSTCTRPMGSLSMVKVVAAPGVRSNDLLTLRVPATLSLRQPVSAGADVRATWMLPVGSPGSGPGPLHAARKSEARMEARRRERFMWWTPFARFSRTPGVAPSVTFPRDLGAPVTGPYPDRRQGAPHPRGDSLLVRRWIAVTPARPDVRSGCRTRTAMAPGRNIVPTPARCARGTRAPEARKDGGNGGRTPAGTAVEYSGTRKLNSSGEEVADDSEWVGDRRAAVCWMGG